jgi:hypothetical protein
MVSMCEVNAMGLREQFYGEISEGSRDRTAAGG